MTVMLMAQMGRHILRDAAHEWIGAGMFVLFVVHHVLNLSWYKTVLKGKYTPYRILRLVIDVLVFAAMIGLMISGIMLSQHVFVFLPIEGGASFARILHMLATYWGFVLMTLHLGLHWSAFTGMAGITARRIKPSPIGAILRDIIGIIIVAYGLYVFINRELLSYMLARRMYVFLDYEESSILFYLDYLAMAGFFGWAAHSVAGLLRKRSGDKTKPRRDGVTDRAVRTRSQIRKALLSVFAVIMVVSSLRVCGENTPRSEAGFGDVAYAPESSVAEDTGMSTPSMTEIEVPAGFVRINGGAFTMGSPYSEAWRGDDETTHSVVVSDFYLSMYEVTQEEYRGLMGDNPSTFSGGNLPAESITWFNAIAYCNARSEKEGFTPVYRIDGQTVSWNRGATGYRLPTEAEWEYACRAGTTTPFNTETSISAEEANYYGRYPYEIEANYFSQDNLDTRPGQYRQTTIAVGSFSPNSWGLYDMHGNVGEWCWDYYGPYPAESQIDPTRPTSGSLRVNRGGGWNDFAKHLRSAYRSATPANNSSSSLGFRLALGSSAATEIVVDTAKATESGTGSGKGVLIVFFSWSGNTRGIAHQIQEMTGADILELELANPYSTNYNTVLDEAQRDQNLQARPELAVHVEDMEQYDTIILGYPNWWASIPMPIASFLEEYDFTGKRILPFCSNGGGRFGQSLTAIAKLVPGATLARGLSVHYSGGPGLPNEISAWLSQNGILEQE